MLDLANSHSLKGDYFQKRSLMSIIVILEFLKLYIKYKCRLFWIKDRCYPCDNVYQILWFDVVTCIFDLIWSYLVLSETENWYFILIKIYLFRSMLELYTHVCICKCLDSSSSIYARLYLYIYVCSVYVCSSSIYGVKKEQMSLFYSTG
jgi:hypothetical protein